VGILQSLFN